jgi:sulfate adenylyltransferase subunit 1
MIVKSDDVPLMSDKLEVMLVWMGETPMKVNADYLIKRASNVVPGRFTHIDHLVDVNSLEKNAAKALKLNEIGQCQLSLSNVISFDPYSEIKGTGSFIVIDRYTHATLAAGMIKAASSELSNAAPVREYNALEKELNALVRRNFPEWGCRSIDDLKS